MDLRSFPREVALFAACAVFTGTVGLIVLDQLVMPKLVRKGHQVQVPNIVDLSPRQARRTLSRYGLHLEAQEPRWDDRIPKGRILIQNPAAFSLVKPGRTVYAIPSKGKRLYVVPNLYKKTMRAATLLVQQSGLALAELPSEPSSVVEEGLIVRQEPAANRQTDLGATVYVVVSSGEEREAVEVPDLVGMKLTEARSAAAKVKLTVQEVRYRFSTAYVPDTVIEQTPAARDTVKSGAGLRLVVSKL